MRLFTYTILGLLFILSSCKGSSYSIVKNPCKFDADPVETEYDINREVLDQAARGGVDAVGLATQAVSLAIDGIQKVIAKEQKKYISEYGKHIKNLYFYDKPSTLGMFDPTGLLFDGVRVYNRFQPKDTNVFETALMLDFELVKDSSWTLTDMVNNGIFHLKLKDCDINYTRAKLSKTNWYNPITWGNKKKDEHLNIDVEIKVKSTYISDAGELIRDETIGTFLFPIRDCPMNPEHEAYETYRKKLIGKRMQGFSFLVPRSAGYKLNEQTNNFEKSYGLGRFELEINVTESGKDKFIERTFYEKAPELFKSLDKSAKKELPKLFNDQKR